MSAKPQKSEQEAAPAKVHTLHPQRGTGAPPAVWAAFARAGAWKSWALFLSMALNFFLVLAVMGLVNRRPDVVLVEPSGKSTYVNPSIAGEKLVAFLNEQKNRPSNVTVVHYTQDFLRKMIEVNSSTIDAAWKETLTMMDASLRERMTKEAAAQKLVEQMQLARVKTELKFEQVELVEEKGDMLHVRAVVSRKVTPLSGEGQARSDRLRVDLVERVVPRTPARPDGLEIAEYKNQLLPSDDAAGQQQGQATTTGTP